jgi:N-methylhydantoinase B
MQPALINAGTEREKSIRKINFLRLVPGDSVKITTSGGGGYGDPLERDPDRVRADVELGYVSREQARDAYGVIIAPSGQLDGALTQQQRKKLKQKQKPSTGMFSLGEARERYDASWTPEGRKALSEILEALPILVRYRIKNEFHNRLFSAAREQPITADEITQCWTDLRPNFYPERYLADQFLPGRQVKAGSPEAISKP